MKKKYYFLKSKNNNNNNNNKPPYKSYEKTYLKKTQISFLDRRASCRERV